MSKQVSEAKKQEVINLRKQGYSCTVIGTLCNISRATARNIIIEREPTLVSLKRNYSKEDYENIARDYYVNNYSAERVMDKYKICSNVLQEVRNIYDGIYRKNNTVATLRLSDETLEEIKKQIADGRTIKSVCKQFNISYHLFSQLGIKKRFNQANQV